MASGGGAPSESQSFTEVESLCEDMIALNCSVI